METNSYTGFQGHTERRELRCTCPPWACLMTCVSTESEAKGFARQWVAARNSHDLDAIMWHYDVDVVLSSPVTAKILDDQSGTVEGKGALPGAVGLPVEQRVAMKKARRGRPFLFPSPQLALGRLLNWEQ